MILFLFTTILVTSPVSLGELRVNLHDGINSYVHHTEEFGKKSTDLVLRRGEIFIFTFNVPTTDDYFDVDLEVIDRHSTDPKYIKLKPIEDFDSFKPRSPTEWPVIITHPNDTATDFQCLIPFNAPISRYNLISKYNDEQIGSIVSTIFVLFNPWNANDSAYVQSENRRDEFIKSQSSKIYLSSIWEDSINWTFSQFDPEVLIGTYELISKYPGLTLFDRTDPVKMSNVISIMATNNTNSNGLLQVNWSKKKEDFADGKHPLDFKSSKDIFSLYLKTKLPVKYGKSWTVAACVTSMFRSLGMASRPVTGDKIGIDGNNNLLIDSCIDEKRLIFTNLHLCDSDFVLNSHVWTEVWMARKDLSRTYPYYTFPSWQIIDGSAGYFNGKLKSNFGPSPVAAVRNGDVNVPFNTSTAFAMIGSPKVLWVVNSSSNKVEKATHVVVDETGVAMITETDGQLLDLTNSYKASTFTFRKIILTRALNKIGTSNKILDLVDMEVNSVSD